MGYGSHESHGSKVLSKSNVTWLEIISFLISTKVKKVRDKIISGGLVTPRSFLNRHFETI